MTGGTQGEVLLVVPRGVLQGAVITAGEGHRVVQEAVWEGAPLVDLGVDRAGDLEVNPGVGQEAAQGVTSLVVLQVGHLSYQVGGTSLAVNLVEVLVVPLVLLLEELMWYPWMLGELVVLTLVTLGLLLV